MITEGYFALIDKYPMTDEIVAVSYSLPGFLHDRGIHHARCLAPRPHAFLRLKNGLMTWKAFEWTYKERIRHYIPASIEIGEILKDSELGETVRLLCWEKAEDKRCHRFTLLDILKERGANIG